MGLVHTQIWLFIFLMNDTTIIFLIKSVIQKKKTKTSNNTIKKIDIMFVYVYIWFLGHDL